jgi:pyrroline-5-carboxylate reductase
MNLGIIGLGTMGGILLQSVLKKNLVHFKKYNVFDVVADKLKTFGDNSQIQICEDIKQLVNSSDMIILAVKPAQMESVLKEMLQTKIENKTIITIAAGLKINFYRKILGDSCFITRVMPNILFSVGEGAAGIAMDPKLSQNASTIIQDIFKTAGKIILCEENKLDVVTGLSGSGPAYIFIIIEAMADGAVKMGLPRKDAYTLAAQTVLGAGKMVLESNSHPGVLKDMVCTPGGTTIEAISVLERGNLRSTIIDAIEACTKKSQSLSS